MNPYFFLISAFYIFGIFYWADSPMTAQIGVFNFFSLLHIPLYGILTVFLALAFWTGQNNISGLRYILAALIATMVGILDEIHQSFIPTRDASITDVLLDATGVLLAIFLFRRILFSLWIGFVQKIKGHMAKGE